MKKKSLRLVAFGALNVFMSLNSFANQWVQFGQNWVYYQDDGTFAKNQWVGNYYLGADGIMLTNSITPDGGYVGADGSKQSRDAWKENQKVSAQYADIISYIAMFVRGEVDFLDPQYKSYSSYYLPTDAPINRENRFGYVLMDIDYDGVDELLLTSGEYGELYDYIYAIVAIKDGKAYPVVYEGGARNRFYLCQNNIISNEGSNGASYSISKYYRVLNGKFIKIESVYSEPGEDSIVWYNTVNHSAPKQISMAEAEQIRNNYVHQSLTPVIIK